MYLSPMFLDIVEKGSAELEKNVTFLKKIKDKSIDLLYTGGIKLIYIAIAIIVGVIVIKLLMKLLKGVLNKTKTEPSAKSFFISLSKVILYTVLLVIIGVILGIKASAFVTAIGAAGIAIGLALQGSLANFAGGILILLFKPFKVGDKVIINGIFGVADEINILYTRIKTYNGKIITMPNGKVSGSDIENRSALPDRRVEIDLWFSFDEDVDKLREIITEAMSKHPDLIEGQPLQLWLQEFHEYSMRMSARCWTNTEVFWAVYWDQIEAIKKALHANNIKFALPKREIHYPEERIETEARANK